MAAPERFAKCQIPLASRAVAVDTVITGTVALLGNRMATHPPTPLPFGFLTLDLRIPIPR
jgi:hypothetical protein